MQQAQIAAFHEIPHKLTPFSLDTSRENAVDSRTKKRRLAVTMEVTLVFH
jgi:hypothetical protein